MKVYVHAWEYVNPGPEAGGGGFDWFFTEGTARQSYENCAEKQAPDWAHFLFSYESQHDAITAEIDEELFDLCAAATVRYVGPMVEQYWKANGMKMEAA